MPASVASRIINDLYDRGLTRKQIADHIGVTGSMVSLLRKDETTISDSKLKSLADLHGKYTPFELVLQKHLQPVVEQTGVSLDEIIGTLRSLRRRKAAIM